MSVGDKAHTDTRDSTCSSSGGTRAHRVALDSRIDVEVELAVRLVSAAVEATEQTLEQERCSDKKHAYSHRLALEEQIVGVRTRVLVVQGPFAQAVAPDQHRHCNRSCEQDVHLHVSVPLDTCGQGGRQRVRQDAWVAVRASSDSQRDTL